MRQHGWGIAVHLTAIPPSRLTAAHPPLTRGALFFNYSRAASISAGRQASNFTPYQCSFTSGMVALMQSTV